MFRSQKITYASRIVASVGIQFDQNMKIINALQQQQQQHSLLNKVCSTLTKLAQTFSQVNNLNWKSAEPALYTNMRLLISLYFHFVPIKLNSFELCKFSLPPDNL